MTSLKDDKWHGHTAFRHIPSVFVAFPHTAWNTSATVRGADASPEVCDARRALTG